MLYMIEIQNQSFRRARKILLNFKAAATFSSIRQRGVLTYQCSLCTYSSAHKGAMKMHILVHTGERHFVCDICHKSFKQNAHLKRHLVVHNKSLYESLL
ncbi:hypothetical protein TNCT_478091 [Trichonephila clavata]|uniref:C2H2-type domain-containing protein n=1 Tax=Trichonephila clavata TaxID=2740835 RepID=A0A8X6HHE4_TRICU|nr:hypothetical protein TNCT_478091 [Trichonephila clavata]